MIVSPALTQVSKSGAFDLMSFGSIKRVVTGGALSVESLGLCATPSIFA